MKSLVSTIFLLSIFVRIHARPLSWLWSYGASGAVQGQGYGYSFTGIVPDSRIKILSQHIVIVPTNGLAKDLHASYTPSGKGSFSKNGSFPGLVLSDSDGGYNFAGGKQ